MAKQRLLNIDESKLIELAKQNDRQAHFIIFNKFSPKMLGVCRQYISDKQYAEDVMISSFYKVLKNINKYNPNGSFEAWIRKIIVNECISYLRTKKNQFNITELSDIHLEYSYNSYNNDIQEIIDKLPIGCKTVFMLYVIEGYKHKEIAKTLNISEGTSKSQLNHARKLLKIQLKEIKDNESNR